MFRHRPTTTAEVEEVSEATAEVVEGFLPVVAGISMIYEECIAKGMPPELATEFCLFVVRKLT